MTLEAPRGGQTDLVTALRAGGLTKDRAALVVEHVERIQDLLGRVKSPFQLVISGKTLEARDPDATFSVGAPDAFPQSSLPDKRVLFDPKTGY